MRGHVGARLVDHLAEVQERKLAHERARVLRVERSPAAAGGLHPLDPHARALDRPLAVREGDAPQRQHDLRGVVDVGVVDVGELERPTARRQSRSRDRPVAADRDLLAEQPSRGADERGMIVGQAAVAERDDR